MLVELPEGSVLLSYRDSGQELSPVFDSGTSLIRDTVCRELEQSSGALQWLVIQERPSVGFCHLVSFSATILEGRGQKRANMSTVAIMVAFILL